VRGHARLTGEDQDQSFRRLTRARDLGARLIVARGTEALETIDIGAERIGKAWSFRCFKTDCASPAMFPFRFFL